LPTPILSPTLISTCAPGMVFYSQQLPSGALSSGVIPDSAGPLLLFHRKPVSASKKDHGRPGMNPGSIMALSPPYPSTQVSIYQTGRLVRGRTWTHVFVVGESTRASQNQDTLRRPKHRQCDVKIHTQLGCVHFSVPARQQLGCVRFSVPAGQGHGQ
jgi:hypothetical protein